MLRGTDISAYQDSIPAGDFCILKATEGLSYIDPPFAARWATLGSEGRLRGAYHFAHPSNPPNGEASFFLSTVEHRGGFNRGDIPVLDFEVDDGMSAAHCASWARQWIAAVENALSRPVVVYTFLNFAETGHCAGLGSSPLWIADPSRAAGQPRVPSPWSHWMLHQYGEPGGVDVDVFNGDKAAWLALGGGHPQPAQEDDDMPYGQLSEGAEAITPISLPKGRYKTIGLICDNGLQGLPPAQLRVAIHGGNGWTLHPTKVDSTTGQAVVAFPDPAATDGISVQRLDKGDVHVAWEVS